MLVGDFSEKDCHRRFFWNCEILEFVSQIKGVIRNGLAVLKIFIPMQLHEDLEQERTHIIKSNVLFLYFHLIRWTLSVLAP